MTTENIKKTITLPKELELEVENRLIGKYYENLSDAIMGVPLRKALEELAQRGVYLRYGAEELEEDLR